MLKCHSSCYKIQVKYIVSFSPTKFLGQGEGEGIFFEGLKVESKSLPTSQNNKFLRYFLDLVLINQFIVIFKSKFSLPIEDTLEQGSQTRGPRASCGPPDAFVRPANTSKNDKSIKLDQILLFLRAFFVKCGPQKLFLTNCGPWSIFSLECGPPTNLSLRPLPQKICFTLKIEPEKMGLDTMFEIIQF